jgi:membrane protein implicated in regulation of membrane protease activity
VQTLIAVYWFCFGAGMLYVLVAGALGMIGHGGHGPSADGGGADGLEGGQDLAAGAAEHDFSLHAAAQGIEAQDLDAGHEADTAPAHADESQNGPQYSPFSPLPIAATLCGFGAGGLISTGLGWPLPLSLLGGLGGGLIAALLFWLVVGKLLYSMQGSSEAHVEDMLGLEATVLTPVEPNASGEIAYVLDGTRYTAPARLLGEGRAAQHETVRIRRMKNNIVYVERKGKLLE